MKLSDILYSLIILGLFIAIYSYSLLNTYVEDIKRNWPKYRCNPTIMPFAERFGHDAGKNFTYCIQTMQGNYMNYLLSPIYYITSVLGDMIIKLLNDINTIRKKIYTMVDTIKNAISSIFGVSFSILLEFQKIITKIKSMIGKMTAILVIVMHLVGGAQFTGQSIVNGPIGDTLRFVKGL